MAHKVRLWAKPSWASISCLSFSSKSSCFGLLGTGGERAELGKNGSDFPSRGQRRSCPLTHVPWAGLFRVGIIWPDLWPCWKAGILPRFFFQILSRLHLLQQKPIDWSLLGQNRDPFPFWAGVTCMEQMMYLRYIWNPLASHYSIPIMHECLKLSVKTKMTNCALVSPYSSQK